MARKKLRISRAIWRASRYKRIGKSGRKGVTWRDKNTGKVYDKPEGGRLLGIEPSHYHSYGAVGLSKKRAQALERFYKKRR